MPPADSAYHIKLNGSGFILADGSYIRRSQQAFNPRFSTGDPSLGDLSFWQFIAQEDWDGGAGQEKFSDTSKIYESAGWCFLTGKPRLTPGASNVLLTFVAPTYRRWFEQAGLLFYQASNGFYRLIKYGYYAAHDGARTERQASSEYVLGVDEIASRHVARWHQIANTGAGGAGKQAGGCVLACTAGANIVFYDQAFNKLLTHATGYTDTLLTVPISATQILVFGYGGGYDAGLGCVAFVRLTKSNAWAVSAAAQGIIGGIGNVLCNSYAIDSSGSIYIASMTIDASAPATSAQLLESEQICGAVAIITSTDATATEPKASDVVYYPNFIINGLGSVAGVVYIFATEILRHDGGYIQHRNVILKYPNTVIWRSPVVYLNQPGASTNDFMGLIRSIHQVSRDEIVFIAQNTSNSWSIMRATTDDVVEEIGCLPNLSTSHTGTEAHDWMGVCRTGVFIYAYDAKNNRLTKIVSNSSSTIRTINHAPILTLSKFGANTSLINKTLYSVTINLTELLPKNETGEILVNDILIGTFGSTDKRAEIIVSTEITASTFQVCIRLGEGSTWKGEIEQVNIRYVPTQFKKLAWGLSVRCDMNQQLLNGQREGKTAADKMAEIVTAWKNNQPIPFVDVDGSSYKVLVTEFSERKPLIATNPNRRESIATLELLEV